MKKVIGIAFITCGLTACSDGDLVFENLNFDNVQIQKCINNELYFKTNNNELLLVDFSNNVNGIEGSVLDTLAPLNQPQNFLTNSTNKIYYRTYDSQIKADAICAILAPANPKVTSEFISSPGGKVSYTRMMTPVVSETGVTINYTYTINFENVTLSNGSSEIKYATLPYGSYVYDSSRMTFNFTDNFIVCDNVLTSRTSNEIIKIQLPQDFVFPTVNQKQTIAINDTNLLRYYVFRKPFTVDEGQECELPNVAIKEDWQAANGSLEIESIVVKNTSGAITGYRHNIKLIQAQFLKDGSTFSIADKPLGTYAL